MEGSEWVSNPSKVTQHQRSCDWLAELPDREPGLVTLATLMGSLPLPSLLTPHLSLDSYWDSAATWAPGIENIAGGREDK